MPDRKTRIDAPLLCLGLVLPPLAAWYYFVVLDGSDASSLAYGITKTVQFLLPLPLLEALLYQSGRFTHRKSMSAAAWQGALWGLGAAVPLALLYELSLHGSDMAQSVAPSIFEKMSDFGVLQPVPYLLMTLFLSVIHSGLEEYYWRWFVFGRLRTYWSFWPALVVSSLGFMAHHVVVLWVFLRPLGDERAHLLVLTSLVVALAGAVWCWLYERTGRLSAPWVSHVFADLVLMYMGARLIWG